MAKTSRRSFLASALYVLANQSDRFSLDDTDDDFPHGGPGLFALNYEDDLLTAGPATTTKTTAQKKTSRIRALNEYYSAYGLPLEDRINRQKSRFIALAKPQVPGKRPLPLMKMIETIEPFEGYITDRCNFHSQGMEDHVPSDLVLGMAVLENGGGTDKRTACCRGIMQLDRWVARQNGLKIESRTANDKKGKKTTIYIDERKLPEKNIDAGIRFLKSMYISYFGDWQLAAQGYHAGPGNVKRALAYCIDRPNHISWHDITPEIVKKYGLSWTKMMGNRQAVRQLLSVHDEDESYLPRAYACLRLYNDRDLLREKGL